MLLKAENLDKKENEIIDEKPIEPFKRIGLYPTKCERCGKLDEYVTKPHQRFCNSCHLDYMMID